MLLHIIWSYQQASFNNAIMASEAAEKTERRRSGGSHKRSSQQWVTKGTLAREDSDDELGNEDYPWHWIYEDDGRTRPSQKRASRGPGNRQQRIVGARMGSFECRLGQVVLLKSPEPGKDWVGIITEFLEVDDGDSENGETETTKVKSANIMWFASPDEFMSTKNKRRADALPNEQYLTADFNVNPLTSINGKADVMSKNAFFAKYPDGKPPKGKAALAKYKKCVICRRGVNQVQGRYTDEFIWEDVYREDSVFDLIDMIKDGLKAAKKRKAVDNEVRRLEFRLWLRLHDTDDLMG